jgi:hypothetical protein
MKNLMETMETIKTFKDLKVGDYIYIFNSPFLYTPIEDDVPSFKIVNIEDIKGEFERYIEFHLNIGQKFRINISYSNSTIYFLGNVAGSSKPQYVTVFTRYPEK